LLRVNKKMRRDAVTHFVQNTGKHCRNKSA